MSDTNKDMKDLRERHEAAKRARDSQMMAQVYKALKQKAKRVSR